MDKKTCMILLLGFIFVILLSNYTNALEGLTNKNYVTQKMIRGINPIKPILNSRRYAMRNYPGLNSNNNVIENYDATQSKIKDISDNTAKLSETINYINGVNNANTASIISKDELLQDNHYITNTYLKNIDSSQEKVNDTEVLYTEYSYDTLLWGIIAIFLLISCLTMIL